MKIFIIVAVSIAALLTGANAREIMTRDEYNTVIQNAFKFAKRNYTEGYYRVWEGEGYRARMDDSNGYTDICFYDSDTERSCYDRNGMELKMHYEVNEWSPYNTTRKRWPGEQPPDLFKK